MRDLQAKGRNSGDGGNRTREPFPPCSSAPADGESPPFAGDSADPEPQASRSKSNCKCGKPCFYCGRPLHGAHEHDHMPIPHRHGGAETVSACKDCHDLKDRLGFWCWPATAMDAANAGVVGDAQHFVMMLAAGAQDPDFDLSIDRDNALACVRSCTTREARIYVAQLVCLALDDQARRGFCWLETVGCSR